jgi:hypothetical protein
VKFLCALLAAGSCLAAVTTIRVPDGGLQPQVVTRDGTVHLIYYKGGDRGDLFYASSRDYGATFSPAIRVNSTPGSAVAAGNIRGAQLAVGRNGRVHVAWNGNDPNNRMPMLYARLNDAGTAFEPERNLIQKAWGIDGGGTLAADARGNVWVLWHAPLPGMKGEENRRVWIAKSTDDGRTFSPERLAFDQDVGACGCCGMKAWADETGKLYVMFRSAAQMVNRDIWLLTSSDGGKSFTGEDVSHWKIGACVMSSEFLAPAQGGLLAAWESEKQVYFGAVQGSGVRDPQAAPGEPRNRKYPVLAINSRGETLFVWAEDMAWKKGGAAEWQLYDPAGHASAKPGRAEGVPVWGLVAAFARPSGDFVVMY